MIHLKTYEAMDFKKEIEQIKIICNFCETQNITEFELPWPVSYKGKDKGTMYIVYDYYNENYDTKCIWQLINNKKEDPMVGIPRDKATQVYDKIMNYLFNLTPEEIEILQMKTQAKKYNL